LEKTRYTVPIRATLGQATRRHTSYRDCVAGSDRRCDGQRQDFGFEVDVASSPNTPPRILCVDDRVSSLEVRRALLTQMGYDVLLASDPPSALAILAEANVDLVVLDYSFPGYISGDELAHQLRAREPGMPLIMLSGFPDLPPDVEDSVDIVLLKGSSQPSDLLNAIARLLKVPRETDTQVPAETTTLRQRNQDLMEKSRELLERSKSRMSNGKL